MIQLDPEDEYQEEFSFEMPAFQNEKQNSTRVISIRSDSSSEAIQYPIVITPSIQILNLGYIEFEKKLYHSKTNLFPIGFKSVRRYVSLVDPETRCDYTCEILDGLDRPIFRVTCADDPLKPIERDSATAIWKHILETIKIRQNK